MSFQENDNSFHEDDGDQDSSGEVQEQQVESTPVPSEPHRRTCSDGYTFCFTLWNQTPNGTRIVKQGKSGKGNNNYFLFILGIYIFIQVAGRTTRIALPFAASRSALVRRPLRRPVPCTTAAAREMSVMPSMP